MRTLILRVVFASTAFAASVTFAQMHKVAKPQQVVRAVGVYEWTGDFAKPTASRLIPVSLYIEGKFEDAGVYIARPVPFALLSGNLYILQSAGVDKGTLDIVYSKHLEAVTSTGDMAYDDGWFGYGSVRPVAAPRKAAALKPSKTLPVLVASSDPNRPHFGSQPNSDTTSAGNAQSNPATNQTNKSADTTTSSPATTSSGDPDRPTMKRRTPDTSSSGTATDTTSTTTDPSKSADDPDRPTLTRRVPDSTTSGGDNAGTTASTQTGSNPADDADRPTMKRRTPDDNAGSASTTTASTTTTDTPAPADDPDRPTLKRRTAEETRKANTSLDAGEVSGIGSLNDDPTRPNLHYGKPADAMTEADLPKLTGLPPNLHQMVAVSDAVNRDPHPFALDWDDEEQHQAVLKKMQALARAKLASYESSSASAATTPALAVKKTTPTAARSRRITTVAPPPPVPLLNEELKAYTLSYGGDATYIYSADTGGTGAALRYVTIVAQVDALKDLKPAIQSVTDAAHLNRSPRMQFVDVVDADASNRASLLFELRSQNVRQFALYRVIAAHSEQIFLTGTTQ